MPLVALLDGQRVEAPKDFPGADLLANHLQRGMYLSLALSVGSIIYGGGSWTWSKWGDSGYAVSGKSWVLGGVIGALISGLAVTVMNCLFTAAGARHATHHHRRDRPHRTRRYDRCMAAHPSRTETSTHCTEHVLPENRCPTGKRTYDETVRPDRQQCWQPHDGRSGPRRNPVP